MSASSEHRRMSASPEHRRMSASSEHRRMSGSSEACVVLLRATKRLSSRGGGRTGGRVSERPCVAAGQADVRPNKRAADWVLGQADRTAVGSAGRLEGTIDT